MHIGDEIDVDELWSLLEKEISTNETDVADTRIETGELLPITRDKSLLPTGEGIVYYTESGSVWHVTPECSSLSRSKDIVSGTVEQAVSAGMERACKRCD